MGYTHTDEELKPDEELGQQRPSKSQGSNEIGSLFDNADDDTFKLDNIDTTLGYSSREHEVSKPTIEESSEHEKEDETIPLLENVSKKSKDKKSKRDRDEMVKRDKKQKKSDKVKEQVKGDEKPKKEKESKSDKAREERVKGDEKPIKEKRDEESKKDRKKTLKGTDKRETKDRGETVKDGKVGDMGNKHANKGKDSGQLHQ